MADDHYRLLCVHGGPGMGGDYFRRFLEPLSDHVSIRTYNQKAGSIDGLTQELADHMIQTRSSIILGHSFGGALVLEAVRRRLIDPAALVLVSWVYDREIQTIFGTYHTNHTRLLREFSKEYRHGPHDPDEAYRKLVLERTAKYFAPACYETGYDLLKNLRYDAAQLIVLGNFLKSYDLKHTVANLKIPVLSIAGLEDRIVSPDYTRIGAELCPSARHVDIAKAGHFPFVDQSEEFCEHLLNFLDNDIRASDPQQPGAGRDGSRVG